MTYTTGSGRFAHTGWVLVDFPDYTATGIPDNGNQQRDPTHRNASGEPGNCGRDCLRHPAE